MTERQKSRSERVKALNAKLRMEYQFYYALGYRSPLIISHLAKQHYIADWTVRDKIGSITELQECTNVQCDLSEVSIDAEKLSQYSIPQK